MLTLEVKSTILKAQYIGYVFIDGNTTVSWMSQLHNILALSTTKVEYVIVTTD